MLEGDLRTQLSELHDLIDSEPPSNDEESKQHQNADEYQDEVIQELPLMVIAENNKLNWIDQSMQYLMK